MSQPALIKSRTRLEELITASDDAWWIPQRFNEMIVGQLADLQVKVVNPPPAEAQNYNCFIYALGLCGDRELISATHGFVYGTLISKMITDGLLHEHKEPVVGDMIFYFDKGRPEHGGVVIDPETIESKWAWGPLVRHSIWSVPISYGDVVRFYDKPSTDQIREWIMNNLADNKLDV